MSNFDQKQNSFSQPSSCEKIKFVFDKPLKDGRKDIIADIFYDERQSIRFILKKDQFIINAPYSKSQQEIIDAVRKKSKWIITNLNKFSKNTKNPSDSADSPSPKKLTVEFSENILPDTNKLSFDLTFDKHKTLRLQIRKEKNIVRVPEGTPEATIIRFIKEKKDWLKKNLRLFAELPIKKPLQAGDTFWFLGMPYEISVIPMKSRGFFQGKKCVLPSFANISTEKAAKSFQLLLAKIILPRRVNRLSQLVQKKLGDNITFTELKIHPQKSRWGSCSIQKILNLSSQLIAVPLPLIDYVIVHELCHLRVMAHNANFHTLVQQIIPDEKLKRAEISKWEREHPRL